MMASVEQGLGKKVASAGIENFKSTAMLQNSGDVTIEGKIGAIHGLDLSLTNDLFGQSFIMAGPDWSDTLECR